MDKSELRHIIRARKIHISPEQKAKESVRVFSQIEQLEIFHSCKNILLYNSLPDELPTKETIKQWLSLKNIFLPRVKGNELEIVPYNGIMSNDNPFHIEEPIGIPVSAEVLDLIIVPAVALDKKCQRMGRGKGFYDRLLSTTNAYTIGVAMDCQLFDTIPTEPHDVPLDAVFTASYTFFK